MLKKKNAEVGRVEEEIKPVEFDSKTNATFPLISSFFIKKLINKSLLGSSLGILRSVASVCTISRDSHFSQVSVIYVLREYLANPNFKPSSEAIALAALPLF